MKTKFKILLFIMFLCISLRTITSTYSRYVAGANGKVDASFAKWQLLVNDYDITNNTSSVIEITPTIEENENVAKDKIAPSSIGYFDILVDPSNVDVSFNYEVET